MTEIITTRTKPVSKHRSQTFVLLINNSECEGIANVITSISLNGTGKKPTDLQQQHKHEHTPISFHAVALNMHFNFERWCSPPFLCATSITAAVRFDHTLLILFYSFLPAKRQRKEAETTVSA